MGDTHRRLWKVRPRRLIGRKSLGISFGRFLDGERSLLGVSPVKIVPAGGFCNGLYQERLGARTSRGAFVIVPEARRSLRRAVVVIVDRFALQMKSF